MPSGRWPTSRSTNKRPLRPLMRPSALHSHSTETVTKCRSPELPSSERSCKPLECRWKGSNACNSEFRILNSELGAKCHESAFWINEDYIRHALPEHPSQGDVHRRGTESG